MSKFLATAFYSRTGGLPYQSWFVPRAGLRAHVAWLNVRLEAEEIIYRMPEILLAAEITFRRLHRHMPQQELNLFQLATACVAQLGTCPPQVVRCDVLQTRPLAAGLDDVPDNVLRDASPPHLSRPGNGSEDFPLADSSYFHPAIQGGFDPFGNRNRPDVTAFADEVHHCPMPLAHLDLVQFQAH